MLSTSESVLAAMPIARSSREKLPGAVQLPALGIRNPAVGVVQLGAQRCSAREPLGDSR